MNKIEKSLFLLVPFLSLTLSSCLRGNIPEGPIKDLLDSFNVTDAREFATTAQLKSTITDYVGGKITGRVDTTFEFDARNDQYYIYRHQLFEGTYVVGDLKELEYLVYSLDKENIRFFHKTYRNNVLDDKTLLQDDVRERVRNFFYLKEDSGFHQGGQYFGDVLYVNGYRYHMNLTLNEKKETLTYKLVNDATHDGVLINQSYTVNKYGMLLNYTNSALNRENSDEISTTISVIYNEELTKKGDLIR